MAIFAISDLHLSFGTDKPMDVFGENWENHTVKLKDNWVRVIGEEDWVLVPGDISWAISLEESIPDFTWLNSLPGKKILSKGNHDYWWSTYKKFEDFKTVHGFHTLTMLYNNAYSWGGYAICGTRGWKSPDEPDFSEEDEKIYKREQERLKLSLKEGVKLGGSLIAQLHYPPFDARHRLNAFGDILVEYGVKACIYGHIHGKVPRQALYEEVEGIAFRLVACNQIAFDPVKLVD